MSVNFVLLWLAVKLESIEYTVFIQQMLSSMFGGRWACIKKAVSKILGKGKYCKLFWLFFCSARCGGRGLLPMGGLYGKVYLPSKIGISFLVLAVYERLGKFVILVS